MVVLKGIPALLSPELLFALAKMGHGDEIVLADANFPTSSICRCGPMEVRADGLSIPQLLESILKLLPLDTYEPNPVVVMDLVESDKAKGLRAPPVWQIYQNLLSQSGCPDVRIGDNGWTFISKSFPLWPMLSSQKVLSQQLQPGDHEASLAVGV
ncbi:fucose mutarotase isoform X4 [Macrotis lagotis]|uniref:fucose mutarotase isoform X4 n=1 Tax=Macrotis lagotis TaxID=92651 RepID=UPI003D6854BB